MARSLKQTDVVYRSWVQSGDGQVEILQGGHILGLKDGRTLSHGDFEAAKTSVRGQLVVFYANPGEGWRPQQSGM